MTDQSNLHGVPGYDRAASSFSAASSSLQTFASEMQRMSKDSFDRTSQMIEKLRSAKTMEDVLAIQTAFMQQSFSMSAEYTRRFGELMIALPMELARNARGAFQEGSSALQRAGEQVGEQVQKAGEQFEQHRG